MRLGLARQDGRAVAGDAVTGGAGIIDHIRSQHIGGQAHAADVGHSVQRKAQVAHRRGGAGEREALARVYIIGSFSGHGQATAPVYLVAAEFEHRPRSLWTHIHRGDAGHQVAAGGGQAGYTGVGVQRQRHRCRRYRIEGETEGIAGRCDGSVVIYHPCLHGDVAIGRRKGIGSHPGTSTVHRVLQVGTGVKAGDTETRVVGDLVGVAAAGVVQQAADDGCCARQLRRNHF